ncbi:MAG UNVERIFIED_CONTAM: AI-2E family transporter [Microcystis novacekii LVE1205-3]
MIKPLISPVFTVVRVLDVLLTIILTFYLLLHSPDIWRSIIQWLPKPVQQPFSLTLRLSFQNYFVGQVTCATCTGPGIRHGTFIGLKLLFGSSIPPLDLAPMA